MALALYISDYIDPDEVLQPLLAILAEQQRAAAPDHSEPALTNSHALSWLMLNGNLLGAVPFVDRGALYDRVRRELKTGRWPQLGVSMQRGGRLVQVQCDEGRACRPVVPLACISEWLTDPALQAYPPLPEMMARGWLEWMDVAESGQHAIYESWTQMQEMPPTLQPKYKYMEVHASLLSGYAASVIPFCLDTETEVLTDDGWKRYDQVDINVHKIATLVDGALVYDTATAKPEFQYDGKMYHLSRESLDFLVTPEHKMWVAPTRSKPHDYASLTATEVFGKAVRYQKNAKWETSDASWILPAYTDRVGTLHPEEHFAGARMDALCEYIGLWLSEGTIRWKLRADGSKSWRLAIVSQHKTANKSYFDSVHERLGLRWNNTTGTDWIIHHHGLAQYLSSLRGADCRELKMPVWTWILSTRQAVLMLDALILGDGTIHNNGARAYYSSSISLMDDFQRLCLHCGCAADIRLNVAAGKVSTLGSQTITSRSDCWRAGVISPLKCRPTTKTRPPAPPCAVQRNQSSRARVDEWVSYSGIVWCLTVPSHIFFVRRNGKAAWTSNSNHNPGPRVRIDASHPQSNLIRCRC